jgi:hypothetical protein
VQRIREQMTDPDLMQRIRATGRDAIDHIHKTILDPNVKDELRSTNSRWAIEKLTGKAKQEIGVESNTLNSFVEIIKQMQQAGETIDVTPREAGASHGHAEPTKSETPLLSESKHSKWVTDNLD